MTAGPIVAVDPGTLRRGRARPGEEPLLIDELTRHPGRDHAGVRRAMRARQERTVGWLVQKVRHGERIEVSMGEGHTLRLYLHPTEVMCIGKPCKWSTVKLGGHFYLRLTTKLLIR